MFDPDKLRWVNAHYLHHADGPRLATWGEPFLPPAARSLEPGRLAALIEGVRGNLVTLADLPAQLAPFLDGTLAFDPEAMEVLHAPRSAEVCAALATALADLAEWRGERVKSAVQSVGHTLGLKGRDLFQPVRAALTGRLHGPELPLIAELLGRERSLERLRAAADMAGRSR